MSRYLACARMQFATVLTYRADFLLTLGLLLVQIYLLRVVWTAVYADREVAAGVSVHTMIAYATLVSVQYALFTSWRFSQIPQRVREGKVAMDLLRPVGFCGQMLAGQVGGTAATLPFILVVLPFALLVGGAAAPASALAAVCYAVSLLLAYVITQLLALTVGMVAFWTLETTGMFMIYRVAAQFLSGALVPLWFMPEPLRLVAQLLPFQATAYTPTAAYLGQLHGSGLAAALGVQVLWVGLLAALARLVWSRAVYRVVVQGG
ncbi:ABC transporter permease [Phytohabitans rumicis]|uniref:ABC transporter permease n=1 Tax=Phytohabitans rumicis TaxID=1076125 RepID=A0A6V8LN63_9ACTN|nr:ABC-2 family transporter protein [Phytohabitans rumicis]GFJ96328.1 ABC transporter permease [Phytohabitans rumicis]